MKKLAITVLALILTLSLAACGGDDAPADTGTGTPTPSSSQGGNTPAGGQNGGGGFVNIHGNPLTAPETTASFEDSVGLSVEGERIVRKYSDKFMEIASRPEGCTIIYQVYEFDAETGELSDSQLWYGGFADDTSFTAALSKYLGQNLEDNLRGYNTKDRFYGYYAYAPIQDRDNDGTVTWDEAVNQGNYEDDVNYILIK